MKLNTMDKELIEIYNIKNIESIKVYDIQVTDQNKILIIPAILICYDGKKYMNLCAKDKYFDVFVKKVIEIYNEEKQIALEEGTTDPFHFIPYLSIDKRSKDILDSGQLSDINSIFNFYKEKESYDNSLLFSDTELNNITPILEYHLQEIFKTMNAHLNITGKITGYRNQLTLDAELNGLYKLLSISYEKKNNNQYHFSISGFDDNNTIIHINISFEKDEIIVKYIIPKNGLNGIFYYYPSDNIVKMIKSESIANKSISYINEELPSTPNELINIANIDHDKELLYFKLPWNAYIGINTTTKKISENERIIESFWMYLDGSNEKFIKRERYSKDYVGKNTHTIVSPKMTLEEVSKIVNGYKNEEGIFIIETQFIGDILSSGYYKNKLANKYFYHIIGSSNIKDIKRDNLISIGPKNGYIENVDLCDDNKALTLLRGN